jgi:hypothetical protein
VEISPPAELNCAMVAKLHAWVENTLQPAAREALGTPVARLRNVSGYVCRARNGLPLGTDRLSEHALANAIDIAGFITADGRTVDVARAWGPTERDKVAAARRAAAAKENKDAKDDSPRKDATKTPHEPKAEAAASVQADRKISLIAYRHPEPVKGRTDDAKSRPRTASLQPQVPQDRPDGGSGPKAVPTTDDDPKKRAEAQFLRRLHKGACSMFGTVLGPEANDLHRDHFHFDLASRRHSAFCQ